MTTPLKEPKAKVCKLKRQEPLPLREGRPKIKGEFNGFCVIISDYDEMTEVASKGFFGKASLSRSYPRKKEGTEIIRRRTIKGRQKFKLGPPRKVVVVPDSDSDTDADYLTNLSPQYDFDYSQLQETVNLGLEEAFYLAHAINCLEISQGGSVLAPEQLWELFQQVDAYFIQNYIVYQHCRAQNWVVKPGIKFGADFLLYKEGPPFYHASYVVIIDSTPRRRSMNLVALLGLNRLCEASGKELMICQIKGAEQADFRDLSNISIELALMKRWIPSQQSNTGSN